METWRGVIEEFREFLPVSDKTPVITLLEGNTPLIKADNLANRIMPGLNLYLKFEGLNPTGSFKDRGMTVAVSKAVEEGSSLRPSYVLLQETLRLLPQPMRPKRGSRQSC